MENLGTMKSSQIPGLITGAILLFFIIISGNVYSQLPQAEWFTGHGTNSEEHVHEGMQTSDSGYIGIGGGIEEEDTDDMIIIKVDANGTLEWQKDVGTENKPGTGYCIIEISDGYIAGGALYDSVTDRTQRFLTKIDFDGNTIWEKFYESPKVGGIRGIDITKNGTIIATGYSNTPNWGEFQGFVFIVDEGDGFIMEIDNAGNLLWENIIDAPQGTKVREIEDGYIVCSCVWNWTAGAGDHMDFCLIKTDTLGNTIWKKYLGGLEDDHLYDFDLTNDGGYILGGHTLSYDVENWDYLLMKTDNDGNEEWHRTFGQPRGYDAQYIHDEAYGVRQTPDGGYIICGGSGDEYSYSQSGHPAGASDEWKVFLAKTDGSGNTLWQDVYPSDSAGNNAGEYLGLTEDGGFIIFVDSDSHENPAPNNFGFLKIEPDTITIPTHGINIPRAVLKKVKNYPNPFSKITNLEYYVSERSNVKITIYNTLGVEMMILLDRLQPAGKHSIVWNATNCYPGIYFYRISTGNDAIIGKMILAK
jgi:hypothetical protein